MSKKLDRDRYYAIVYGDPEKKAYQDGMYFNGQGEAVSSAEHAAPPAARSKAAPKDAPGVAKKVEPDDKNLAELKSLHLSKLKPMAVKLAKATGTKAPPMSGKGLKARLVAYIAKHTE